jgi:hypothetical protein
MKKLPLILVGILILSLLGLAGCSYMQSKKAEAGNSIDFEVVDPYSADAEIADWYEKFMQEKGIHRLDLGEFTYILVSDGERSSGGYVLEIKAVSADPDTLKVEAVLTSPGADDMTITVITYPSALIRIQHDTRALDLVLENK